MSKSILSSLANQPMAAFNSLSDKPEISFNCSYSQCLLATKFIHEKIFELRDRDAAILISSADLAEIMELSDSLIVMYEGEIAAYFKSLQGITEETLGEYMLGIKKQTPEEIKEAFYEQ